MVPPFTLLEETTSVELVSFNPLRSIQVPLISVTSRMPLEAPSPLVSRTCSSLVMARAQLSPFQRVKVSSCPSLRREMPRSMKNSKLMRKMIDQYNSITNYQSSQPLKHRGPETNLNH